MGDRTEVNPPGRYERILRDAGVRITRPRRIILTILADGGDHPDALETRTAEMGSNETIKQAVMAGLGIAFISAHTIAFEVETGRLAILDVSHMPIRRQWFAVSRKERIPAPADIAFKNFLMQRGASYLPLLDRLYPADGGDAASPPATGETAGAPSPT